MFSTIQLDSEHREDAETLGSKTKFWVLYLGEYWLFKETRTNTGEDWSEKVAGELAQLLKIPAAEIQLAQYDNTVGCISKNFIDRERGQALVHGNEILEVYVTGYDKSKKMRQSDHTVNNIIHAMQGLFPNNKKGQETALSRLASYLVLDALISNTDRHHENWGLQISRTETDGLVAITTAPSFDHASSLGRELLDEKRHKYLSENSVLKYVKNGRGGVFWNSIDRHGPSPLALVEMSVKQWPKYFESSLQKVANLDVADIRAIVNNIPSNRASDVAKEFAYQMIVQSQNELRNLL